MVNKRGDYAYEIQAKCSDGRKHNDRCRLRYYDTKSFMLLDKDRIIKNYYAQTYCQIHKIVSDPIFYQNDHEKLYMNWAHGDMLYRSQPFWSIQSYLQTGEKRKYLSTKYHVSESLYDVLHQSMCIDTKSVPDFCHGRVTEYTATYRPLIKSVYKLQYQPYVIYLLNIYHIFIIYLSNIYHIYRSVDVVRGVCSKIFDVRQWKECYANLIFGHIRPKLEKATNLIATWWRPDIYLDATHSGISTVYSKNLGKYLPDHNSKRVKLNFTTHRLCNENGQIVSSRFLEHGGEKYSIILPQLAQYIAKMISEARMKYNGIKIHDFWNNINFDRGTAANPDKIRDILLYYIKKELKLSQSTTKWKNNHGVHFDFTCWYINVCKFIVYLINI